MRVLVVSVALLFAGFALAEDKKPAPAKGEEVSGKITLDGKPLAGATVRFHPVNPKMDGATTVPAETAEDGTYRATGLLTAEYRVTIIKLEPVVKGDPPKDAPPPKNVLPAKFADPNTSGLTIEIKEGKQVHDIVLMSK